MTNELLQFEDGTLGLALNLEAREIGVIVLGEFSGIEEGQPVRRTGQTDPPQHRRQVDDAAAALGQHHAHLVLHAKQRAQHVGVEGGRVAVGRRFGHRAGQAFGASVVDRCIQAAEARHRLVDQLAHIVFAPHIGLHEFGFGTQRTQLGDQLGTSRIVSAGDDDARAVLRKRQGGGAADACQGAGDQDDGCAHGRVSIEFGGAGCQSGLHRCTSTREVR